MSGINSTTSGLELISQRSTPTLRRRSDMGESPNYSYNGGFWEPPADYQQTETKADEDEISVQTDTSTDSNKYKSFRKLIVRFADKTSMQGVPYINSARLWYAKVIWTLLLVIAIGWMCFHLYYLITQFIMWPKQTKIKLSFSNLEMPAVTICNVNPIRNSAVKKASKPLQNLIKYVDPYEFLDSGEDSEEKNIDWQQTQGPVTESQPTNGPNVIGSGPIANVTRDNGIDSNVTRTGTTEQSNGTGNELSTGVTEDSGTDSNVSRTGTTEQSNGTGNELNTGVTEDSGTDSNVTRTGTTEQSDGTGNELNTGVTEDSGTDSNVTRTGTTEQSDGTGNELNTGVTEDSGTDSNVTRTGTTEQSDGTGNELNTGVTEDSGTDSNVTRTGTTEQSDGTGNELNTGVTEDSGTDSNVTRTGTTEQSDGTGNELNTGVTEDSGTDSNVTRTGTTEQSNGTGNGKTNARDSDIRRPTGGPPKTQGTSEDGQPAKGRNRKKRFVDDFDNTKIDDYEDYDEDDYKEKHEPPKPPRDPVSNLEDTFRSLYFKETRKNRVEMGHQIKDMLISCSFDGYECFPDNFTRYQTMEYGNCYKIQSSAFTSKSPGPQHGLTMILFMENDEYLPGFTQGYGARVTINDQYSFPYPADEGFFVSSAFETHIGLKQTNIERLGNPYGECDNGVEFEKRYGLRYSRHTCQATCHLQTVIDHCGCHDVNNMEVFSQSSLLDTTKPCRSREELKCQFEIAKELDDKTRKCECYNPCVEKQWIRSISTRQWPTESYTMTLLRGLCQRRPQQCKKIEAKADDRKISLNFLKIVVYYQDLNHEEIMEDPEIETAQFASDVGGAIGLWIGLSILSMFEVVQLFVEMFQYGIYKCKHLGEMGRNRKPNLPSTEDKYHGQAPGVLNFNQSQFAKEHLYDGRFATSRYQY
ncbi:uncharacterized protein LOC132562140 [Ylistrum balloti]|uniref:uncharacterized protein LOC132562140 n=1 Tax=Ylistrum balloti TaxID=509963 RepID=UPI002905ECD5|nr:uncharacterized protein LOC132562140 [Ylistrum balloti]